MDTEAVFDIGGDEQQGGCASRELVGGASDMVPGVAVRLAAGTEQTKMSSSGQGEANRA
jgi:hypothetical protein